MHTKTPGMSLYVLLLIIYKFLLDFVFLKVYYSVYAYLINGTYEWNPIKYLISVVFFGVFLLLTYANPTEKFNTTSCCYFVYGNMYSSDAFSVCILKLCN